MAQVLISGKHWTARALLRAQLIEEGFDVEAYEDAQSLNQRLLAGRTMPALLIADLFESENAAEDAATLSYWAKLAPVWVMAAHGAGGLVVLEGRGFERVLFRPLDVGKLVQEIKDRLAG